MEKEKNIRVLTPMFGFVIGATVTPDSSFYKDFRVWAEQKSTITDDRNKVVQICEFIGEDSVEKSAKEEQDDDSLSMYLQWKIAEKRIKEMTSEEEISVFTKGDDRQVIANAVTKRIAEIKNVSSSAE